MRKLTIIAVLVPVLAFTSCQGWLMETPAGTQTLDEYYVGGQSCEQVVVGCYAPMQLQYRDGIYFDEWIFGDICSDDAYKGGQTVTEDSNMYDFETLRTNADNDILLQFYRIQYVGIARCNRAIQDIAKQPVDEYMDESLRARFVAEAKCLRAFYYMRLVRIFGRIPYYTEVIEGTSQMNKQRADLATIWSGIITDLKDAAIFLWPKSQYPETQAGHVTQGTAQALLVKAFMTGHEVLDALMIDGRTSYQNAVYWGQQIVSDGEYELCPVYWDNFTLKGENGIESVFEIQYTDDATSDYGRGGHRGAFTVRQQRCRSSKFTDGNPGWGYNRPTQDLIDEFEDGDPRLAVSFHYLQDGEYDNQQIDLYGGIIRWLSLKYAMMTDGENGGVFPLDASNNPHDPINTKEIRYADVLLMYAEACVETGDTQTAKDLLEMVRHRARGGDPDVLPEFPGYEIRIWNGTGYDAPRQLVDNVDDLRAAIRHERRVELAMEGHRWFDLNRWGITAEVINAQNQTDEARTLYAGQIQSFRKGVNEIFPIPAEERRLTGIDQNEGY